ncbi:MAG TPA: hypothetical protein VJR27_04555 [Candidatus Saccharimonadales bacterium]|nr:hypothetical protein [Candidatus Saccharimonadales bacterium]
MQSITEILKTLANSAVQAGLIAALIGGISAFYMLIHSTKRTKQTKATKLDALYLSYSSPGFSRFSMLNSPDTMGMGVYAALALEQVGAINDIKSHIEVNLKLYPEWPATYLSAARYCALIGEKQKARDYLSVANTLADSQKITADIPQLEKSVIEALIASEAQPQQSTTSLEAMFEELRKKPHLLILARSVWLLLLGLGLVFVGVLLHIARGFIS